MVELKHYDGSIQSSQCFVWLFAFFLFLICMIKV